jgi:hypothetical protein
MFSVYAAPISASGCDCSFGPTGGSSPKLNVNASFSLSGGARMAKSDPTKDPEFQKVVQTFLHTKPQPHQPKKKAAKKAAKRKPKS